MRTSIVGGLKVLTHQGSVTSQITNGRVDLRQRYAQLHTSRVMEYDYSKNPQ